MEEGLYRKNWISGNPAYATNSTLAAVAETEYLDHFFKILADNLMLDELLCGECNSVEFLKNQIIISDKQLRIQRCADEIQRLNNKVESIDG